MSCLVFVLISRFGGRSRGPLGPAASPLLRYFAPVAPALPAFFFRTSPT